MNFLKKIANMIFWQFILNIIRNAHAQLPKRNKYIPETLCIIITIHLICNYY